MTETALVIARTPADKYRVRACAQCDRKGDALAIHWRRGHDPSSALFGKDLCDKCGKAESRRLVKERGAVPRVVFRGTTDGATRAPRASGKTSGTRRRRAPAVGGEKTPPAKARSRPETKLGAKKAVRKAKTSHAGLGSIAVVREKLRQLATEEPYYACESWRRTPYDITPYDVLPDGAYVAGVGVEDEDAKVLFDRLNTSVRDGWTDYVPVSVSDGTAAAATGQQPSMKAHSGLELDLSTEKLRTPLRLGVDVEERPLWGMDCFTREAILASISGVAWYAGDENRPRRVEYLQQRFLPKLHTLGADGWDASRVAQCVLDDAIKNGEKHTAMASRALLRVIAECDDDYARAPAPKKKKANSTTTTGEVKAEDHTEEIVESHDPRARRERFRIHPKGTGVVCINPNGLKAGTFVNHYIGEIYSPWKWYERQDAIKKCYPGMELPSFFNITLERPPHDDRGRHVSFVEAMHKGCFASRLSHSCEPNCQTVTFAKGGKLTLGMFTTQDIAYGEEMTWDYSCITESAEEYRTGFCLCSSPTCRGSFLTYSGSGAFTAVVNKKHAFLHRNAILFKASTSALTNVDRKMLHDSGIRECALEHCPDWVVKWAALTLEYIKLEENELPNELMSLPATRFGRYNELGAKSEATGVAATRITNLIVTLDKIRYVLTRSGQERAPFFRVLTESEVIEHLWSGDESILRRILRSILAGAGAKKGSNSVSKSRLVMAKMPKTGDARVDAAMKAIQERIDIDERPKTASGACESMLEICTILRRIDATFYAQVSDLLWFYANTRNWFTHAKLDNVISPAVNIDDVASVIPTTQRKHIPNAFRGNREAMLQKRYGALYVWGQLVTWYKQTIYSPDSSLSADRRGTLSLPDPESCCSAAPSAYVNKERKELFKALRKNKHQSWPTATSWSFKNPAKVYGSPMFDDALREMYPKEYASTTSFTTLLDKHERQSM